MLPAPVSFHVRRDSKYRSHRRLRDILLTRARVTNLALFLLAAFSAVSFLFNLSYYLHTDSAPAPPPPKQILPDFAVPYSIITTVARDKALPALEHLVIVPGHAIWEGSRQEHSLDEDSWLMDSFQNGDKKARIVAYHEHIVRGIDIAAKDEKALLVFSGGHTKNESPSTEAQSYMRLAQATGLLPPDPQGYLRVTTEDDALDSYQNLLFSVARFHEYTGRYPVQITVVGYEMKRRRFEELHRVALRWPEERFQYVGFDAEGQDIELAREGERKNGYLPYLQDTYGCHDVLLAKRRSRNQGSRFHPYFTSSPELAGLFNWCPGMANGGQTAMYSGPLPWDRLQ